MSDTAATPSKKQALVLLVRGLPGSGKTYITAELVKQLPQDRVVLLDPDAIDQKSAEYQEHVKQQTAEGVDPKLHLYRFSRAKAYQGIADGGIVIWNQPFTNLEIFQKMTANFYLQAQEQGVPLRLLVVEVVTNPDIAKKRVETRKQAGGHGPTDGTFGRFVEDYKSFADEGYETVTVYGEDDTGKSVGTILRAINS